MTKEEFSSVNGLCTNLQDQLYNSVKNNDVNSIRSLVAQDETILEHEYGYPYYKPILYIACDDFAKQVLVRTIECLIRLGANLYQPAKRHNDKEAIHFAIDGNNPEILNTIIKHLDDDKINSTAKGNTALYLLIKNYEKAERKNSEQCLNILLQQDNIDVNIDNNNITPILWAAYKEYKNVVTAILNSNKFVDIDEHKLKTKSARELITEKRLYDGVLLDRYFDNNENSINLAMKCIKERNQEGFLKLNIEDINDEIEAGTLLQLACERNLYLVVQRLLDDGVDVNKQSSKNKEYPLEIAAKNGYYKIFKLLITKYTKLPDNLLTLLLRNLGSKATENINYNECLKILFKEKNDISVNTCSGSRNTPLHYAAGYTDSDITLELLQRGASLGNINDFGCLPIEDIDPHILKEHFDRCVTVKDRHNSDKQSIVVTFDYTTLIPTNNSNFNETDIESGSSLIPQKQSALISEAGAVYAMSRIPEMHHLLVHPLISSFLFIKWHRMRWFFRINFLLFAVFCLSLITYVFLPDNNNIQEEYKVSIQFLWFVLILTYGILVFREILQTILSFQTYWRSVANILEVVMLCICFYVIFYKSSNLLYKQLSSVAIILVALEVMILLGQHPKLSTNIVMLRTVAKNFFLFLAWYSILIIAFALSFYKLFNKANESSGKLNSTIDEIANKDEDKEQDFFVEPGLTFIKIIVMLTGEFDASSIDFETLANKLIFLAFVFMIPIILFNLLNGLAVSDTQIIKNDAEIMGYIERINYIIYIENIILGNTISNLFCLYHQCFACCEINNSQNYNIVPKSLMEQISLYPHYLETKKMEIIPFHEGKILNNKNRQHCLKICQDVYVDKKTVKRVKQLLFDKNKARIENQRTRDLLETIECQKNIIEQLKIRITNS